ncbi:MAG: methylaspartate mutase subunit S [Pirellulales bacterium]|nr:methylaspartate mutase subunit S [Pirellulales bacterium]
MSNLTIILGVIGSDCHSVGNKILDAFFTERGFQVVNLGVMVSPEEFVAAAAEHHAAAILVSSLYGHGELDCAGLRDRCTHRGLDGILLGIGGNLVVGKTPREVVQEKFRAMGFDYVFFPGDDLEEFARRLREDLLKAECHVTHVSPPAPHDGCLGDELRSASAPATFAAGR